MSFFLSRKTVKIFMCFYIFCFFILNYGFFFIILLGFFTKNLSQFSHFSHFHHIFRITWSYSCGAKDQISKYSLLVPLLLKILKPALKRQCKHAECKVHHQNATLRPSPVPVRCSVPSARTAESVKPHKNITMETLFLIKSFQVL